MLWEITNQLEFAVQGSYTYSLLIPYLFDLDYLELRGNFPALIGERTLLSFTLGRYYFTDFSGYIFSHTIDGFTVEMSLPDVTVSTSVGYTGLLLKPTSSIIISKADLNDQLDTTKYLAPPRLIGELKVEMHELLLREDIFLSFLLQQDLRMQNGLVSEGEIEEYSEIGGRVHSQYYGLGVSTPIYGPVFAEAQFFLETGSTLSYLPDSDSATQHSYQAALILGWLARGNIDVFLDEFLYSVIEIDFLYTSGDRDYSVFLEGNSAENAHTLVPVSNQSFAFLFSPLLGNIFSFTGSYSVKPFSWLRKSVLQNVQSIIKTVLFFRSVPGPISLPVLKSDSQELYLGTELDWSVNFRPFSDLGLALYFGIFVPHDAVFLPEESQVRTGAGLLLTFSF